jgi:hypothetical protein
MRIHHHQPKANINAPKKMPEPKPQLGVPQVGSRIAIGAADRFPVVLIEVAGALGVLVAERRCPDETLERVLYFRALMGQPYARFFENVELLTLEGFSVAQAMTEDALFFEPSSIPYAIKNISEGQYEQFVDDVVAYRCERAERLISSLFVNAEGFSIDAEGRLKAPAGYANAMDHFLSHYNFVEPNEPSRQKG